jgi:hypothetical protein
MDLANSLTWRLPKRLLKADDGLALPIAFNLLFMLALAAVGNWKAPLAPDVLLLASVQCGLWRIHLQGAGRSWVWSAFLASAGFLGWLLPISSAPGLHTLQFFGGAVIVYGMTWSFAVFGRDEMLRPLANIAFLLGVSVFASSAALLAAVLISLIFFVVCRWKFETGHWWDTALLIFTPAVFAALAIYGLHWLGVHAVYSPEISALLPNHYIVSTAIFPVIIAQFWPGFLFFAAVLLLRLLRSETGRADLTLTFIIGLLMLAMGSQKSTGVGPRDVALCLAVASAALLSALPGKTASLKQKAALQALAQSDSRA